MVVAVGLLGLLIGSFLNVVIWRVPRGQSLLPDSRCPKCGAAIRPWHNVPVISWVVLRGKCARCSAAISVRYPLIELATAVTFGLVTWWFVSAVGADGLLGNTSAAATAAAWLSLGAYLWFAAVSIALTAIDLELQRLPDAIVLPSLAVVTALLLGAAALLGECGRLVTILAAAAALFAFYFVVVLVYPKGMGGGDVKLAPLIGAVTGSIGWASVAVGAFAGFVIGALVGLILMTLGRVKRKQGIPFGPFMLLGAWVGLLWGPEIMGAYLALVGLG